MMNKQVMWQVTMATAVLAAGSAGGGCATEGDSAEEAAANTGESEQAFSYNWSYSWAYTSFNSADIGSATNRACFMSGVSGYLTSGNNNAGDGSAGVYDAGDWHIYVSPSTNGMPLKTMARCVDTTSLTPAVTWRVGAPRIPLAPVTESRRCFFTSVTSLHAPVWLELQHGAFQSTTDSVWIEHDSANWYINGNTTNPLGPVDVTARCIDVTADLGELSGYAAPGSSGTTPLVPATNGATCLLTQITGKLDSTDWDQGPYVDYNAAYNYFDFKYKNGTGGKVRCVR